jgi:glycosyltransferase involved in cell wall biosynthesis
MNPRGVTSLSIRVCHIAHGDLWAGAEVQLVTLLEALVLNSRLELSAILLNEGRLACEIRKLGIPVTVLAEERHNSLALCMKIVTHLRAQRPVIVHTHKYKDNILAGCAAAAAAVPTVVRVVHGMTEPFRGKAYVKMMGYEFVDRLVTRTRVNKVIAVSSNIEAVLRRLYGTRKVVQIHNGINLDKIRPSRDRHSLRAALGIGTDDQIVGTVGRLVPVKGHDVLLRAASALLKKRWNLKFLIVGDGPLRSKLADLTRELGIEKEVILAGQRDDVYDLIDCMDVFTLPSTHEGIPMVLLEALALKRPVVASCVGGIPEVLENGVSGLLVAPNNVRELEQGIDRILQDRLYASQLGEAGRARVEAEFTAELMAKRTADLYCSILSAS